MDGGTPGAGPREVLEVVGGPDRGARFAMLGDQLGLGREPDMDAVMSDPRVSRRHARLAVRDDALYVEDLGSSSGTAVNGIRIVAATAVRAGDRVAIGASELLVLWAPSGAPITEEGPLVGIPGHEAPWAGAPTAVLGAAGPPPAHASPPPPAAAAESPPGEGGVTVAVALRLIVAASAAVLGVLVLVTMAPAFLGGQSIAGGGGAGIIAQTVLEALALIALGVLFALYALGIMRGPSWVERVLAAGLLLVGGEVLGAGMMPATLSVADRGPGVWLLLVWGLLAVGAGAAALYLTGTPAPLRRDPAIAAGAAAGGGLLCAVAGPLTWVGTGAFTFDGFDLGSGKALLSFGIIMVLAAGGVVALWATGRETLGALVARAGLVPLGGLLFGFGLTACTVLSDATLRVGAVLALVGGLIALGAVAVGVLIAEARPGESP